MSSRHYPHRLVFRRPTETTNDSGQVVRSYADAFSRRGRVVQSAGGKSETDGQQRASASFRVEVPHDRAQDGLDFERWQVVWKDTGQVLNLTAMSVDYTGRVAVNVFSGTLNR